MIPARSLALTAGAAATPWERRSLAAFALPRVASQSRLFPARASLSFSAAPMSSQAALTKTVFVKTEGAPSWAELEVPIAASVARVLKEATKKLPSLKDQDLDKLTLHLDTAGSLGDALDSRKKLSEQLDDKDGISLVIKGTAPAVLAAAAAPLVPLESPLESTVVPMGDAEMLRITRSNGMPFFLTPESFRRLDDFAREEHLDKGSRVLVIGGPVKSGKTTVLHEVLPALVAAHRQKGSALPEPVIMRFTFYEVGLPEAAADRLVKEAIRLAAVFGIHITGPSSQSDALNRMDIFLDIICRQFHASGRQLWLLLDEVQGPVLSSPTVSDAIKFTIALKAVARVLYPHGRMAITGSSMVALLNQIRAAPMRGFAFIAALDYVQLGATPSDSAATAMAAELLEAWKQPTSRAAPALEPGSIVAQLSASASGGVTSTRPALLAELIANTRRGAMAQAIAEDLRSKLLGETMFDMCMALGHLADNLDLKKALYALAAGNARAYNQQSLGPFSRRFLEYLCEPARPSLQPVLTAESNPQQTLPVLLPPYATCIKLCLSADGSMLRHWANPAELASRLRDTLVFFGESYAKRKLHRQHLEGISKAVLECLADNNIGLPEPATGSTPAKALPPASAAADIDSIPVLHALLRHEANSDLAAAHDSFLANGGEALARYNSKLGFQVLRWIRNIIAYSSQPATTLADAGLPAALLDSILLAATKALYGTAVQHANTFVRGPDGIPIARKVLHGSAAHKVQAR